MATGQQDPLPESTRAAIAARAAERDAGPSAAGSPIVRAFPFAFDTPDLLTGAPLYTPTPGDILLDAWIEIDTAWDGTSPRGDFGTFVGANLGFYMSGLGLPLDMTQAAVAQPGLGVTTSAGPTAAQWNALAGLISYFVATGVAEPFPLALRTDVDTASGFYQVLPSKFATADPIKVCVSQDGTNTGDDPGSTVGSAVLFLVTATPA